MEGENDIYPVWREGYHAFATKDMLQAGCSTPSIATDDRGIKWAIGHSFG